MTRRFQDNPDNAPEKQLEYKLKLEGLSDQGLADECDSRIWLSAYANNNPASCYHWQCDACYDECVRREKPEIYSASHKRQVASCN